MGELHHIIGIGELAASARPDAVLKTFGLGSCVALILYDPALFVGGMVHVALPDSSEHRADRVRSVAPGHYADLGIELLLRTIGRLRGSSSAAGLHARLVGGANVLPNSKRFYIGKRNIEMIRNRMRQLAIPIRAEDVGGDLSRTVFFEIASGAVTVVSPGRKHIVFR